MYHAPQILKPGCGPVVEPNYSALKAARLFTLPVEHLDYVMRCFASISA